MPESYEERRARRASRAAANERDPEKLKQWYELAGEAAEDPDKEIQASAREIAAPRKERKRAASTGTVSDAQVMAMAEAGPAILVSEGDRHLRPKLPLGKDKHREIYGVTEATRAAQEQGRSTPTKDEIEQHARSWDVMPDDSKHYWQQSPHGKAATAQAIAEDARVNAPSERRVAGNTAQAQSQKRKVKVVGAAFSTPEQAKEFKSNDRLLDEDGNDETNWRKPFSLANVTGQQKISELSPTKAVEGVALDTDSSHLEALDSHLNELSSRPSAGVSPTLQGNQFNNKEGLLTAAKHAMARSAMAHSLGMKEAAVRHFSDAINHAGNLAKVIHGVNSDPISDWDKQEDILHKYKSRSWNQGGRRY